MGARSNAQIRADLRRTLDQLAASIGAIQRQIQLSRKAVESSRESLDRNRHHSRTGVMGARTGDAR